jgi:hypothetical protein
MSIHKVLIHLNNRLNKEYTLHKTIENIYVLSSFDRNKLVEQDRIPYVEEYYDQDGNTTKQLYIPRYDTEKFLGQEKVISKLDAYCSYLLEDLGGQQYKTLDTYGDEDTMDERIGSCIAIEPICIMYKNVDNNQYFIELVDLCFDTALNESVIWNHVKIVIPNDLIDSCNWVELGVGKRAYYYKETDDAHKFELRIGATTINKAYGEGWYYNEKTGRVILEVKK